MNRRALGRGLDALIPTATSDAAGPAAGNIAHLPVGKIVPNPNQPRTRLDPDKLHELVASIRSHGVLQPILVKATGDTFQLIAGERRWTAAKEAGLETIPALVVEHATDVTTLEWALIENLQREDLNPLDEAVGYKRLAELFGHTQETIAQKVGKDRSTVSNTLRLLALPESVRNQIAGGRLSAGHARALLALERSEVQVRLANRIVSESLSVRRTEEMVYGRPKRTVSRAKPRSPELDAVERRLRLKLGTTVHIVETKKRGRVIIDYFGHNDLNRLLDLLGMG
ncbi:MAG TPA: ParB/RepB/Spo0J family partition protein [Acidobacteriota bacterium]|nr:ParB/RepB/Spo0J family partition protein [Acidobacteriota bacterium]